MGKENYTMKQSVNSKSGTSAKSSSPLIKEALFGTTGIAVLGAAAVGVAGYFAWRNREKIIGFVGNYVDLPESITSLAEDKDFTKSSDVGTLASSSSTYTQPSVEHRM
jgi:hypothetical protein